ncbi:hypothetical protein QBC34DRAFT_72944 [Podospora aff. communis PSN243]|uniref:Uncharacterized protein n=1 Tax=Podospora aff. communis PSN243 TaxID=3040156 RepID=A0AAV9H7D4_9PEZI|nr:hypothetical protein QBC34DRAFT_72944 [Podospora aff. communis PSN243]
MTSLLISQAAADRGCQGRRGATRPRIWSIAEHRGISGPDREAGRFQLSSRKLTSGWTPSYSVYLRIFSPPRIFGIEMTADRLPISDRKIFLTFMGALTRAEVVDRLIMATKSCAASCRLFVRTSSHALERSEAVRYAVPLNIEQRRVGCWTWLSGYTSRTRAVVRANGSRFGVGLNALRRTEAVILTQRQVPLGVLVNKADRGTMPKFLFKTAQGNVLPFDLAFWQLRHSIRVNSSEIQSVREMAHEGANSSGLKPGWACSHLSEEENGFCAAQGIGMRNCAPERRFPSRAA